jgi:hypothetical protein
MDFLNIYICIKVTKSKVKKQKKQARKMSGYDGNIVRAN